MRLWQKQKRSGRKSAAAKLPLGVLQVWLWSLALVAAQQNLLQDPSLTTFELSPASSATFHLKAPSQPSTSKDNAYYITLNICSVPSTIDLVNLYNLSNIPVMYLFNSSSQTDTDIQNAQRAATANGFANLTTIHPSANDQGVWITVNAPAASGSGVWSYQLGVSTTEPMHVVDKLPYFQFDDSDNTSALLTSPTYFPTLENHPKSYLVMLPTATSDIQQALLGSACFIQSDSNQVRQTSINISDTTRGVYVRSAMEGATDQEKLQFEAGGVRSQYVVDGLQPAANYTVIGLQYTGLEADQDAQSVSAQSTRIYQPQYFNTKTGNNCRLISESAACPNVAYAVPAPPEVPTPELLEDYENRLQPNLEAFNTTLNIFPCGMNEQGNFSSVRTCADCFEAYRTWLCSIVLPQCTDIPAPLQQSAQVNYTTNENSQLVFSDQPIPESVQLILVRDNPALSRTPQLSPSALANNPNLSVYNPTTPFPYGEVPLCLDVCNNVAASCPYFISWNCPLRFQTLAASYGLLQDLPPDARQGGNSGSGSSSDRWGNQFCNAAQVDVLLAVRSSISKGSRHGTPIQGLYLTLVTAALTACLFGM